MVKTTRAQRVALFELFRRDFPNWVSPGKRRVVTTGEVVPVSTAQWRRFRATVQRGFGDDYVGVPWCGMYVGIERDGYAHT